MSSIARRQRGHACTCDNAYDLASAEGSSECLLAKLSSLSRRLRAHRAGLVHPPRLSTIVPGSKLIYFKILQYSRFCSLFTFDKGSTCGNKLDLMERIMAEREELERMELTVLVIQTSTASPAMIRSTCRAIDTV